MKDVFYLILLMFFSCSTSEKVVENKTHTEKETIITPKNSVIPESIKEVKSVEEVKIEASKHFIEKVDHSMFNSLLQNHVSKSGNVNYEGFIHDKEEFKYYQNILSENVPTNNWTQEDKLAYWMNAYNAFTIELILQNYPIKSIKDIKNAWKTRFFKLGEKWYNLDEIEHQILRKMNDPRIHFGINCASISCPPILNKAFTAKNINFELEGLTYNFINNDQYNSITENHIEISKLFLWYAKDFKTKVSLIDFLSQYVDIPISKNAKVSYKKYNWSLNE